MDKETLIKKLNKLACEEGAEAEDNHAEADKLLIKYIDDKEITTAYNEIFKWYA
jgi:hypothetical protein